jgi:hypothetical protein
MRFIKYLIEGGGEKPGTLEILNTPLEKARMMFEKMFKSNNKELDKEIPEFDDQYEKAKQSASLGHTKRKDMPVISSGDVKSLQDHLAKGKIDIYAPFSPDTDQDELFPERLKGSRAKGWLSAGEPQKDNGRKEDDVVRVTKGHEAIWKLKPIQKQIYVSKVLDSLDGRTVDSTIAFLGKSVFIVSQDDFIIDGHHRWLSGMLLKPKMHVHVLRIDLPINELIALSRAFGDAVGNERNA